MPWWINKQSKLIGVWKTSHDLGQNSSWSKHCAWLGIENELSICLALKVQVTHWTTVLLKELSNPDKKWMGNVIVYLWMFGEVTGSDSHKVWVTQGLHSINQSYRSWLWDSWVCRITICTIHNACSGFYLSFLQHGRGGWGVQDSSSGKIL